MEYGLQLAGMALLGFLGVSLGVWAVDCLTGRRGQKTTTLRELERAKRLAEDCFADETHYKEAP